MNRNIFLPAVLTFTLFFNLSFCQQNEKIYGVTIDGINNLNNIVNTIGHHSKKMTTRIVFDEWQPASNYTNAVNRIDSVSYIMGEILDSYYMSQYSVQEFNARVVEYYTTLGNKVDIWEIGNEINGEWLGNRDSVIRKISYALMLAYKYQFKTALTLYYNYNCWENPDHEMFKWVNRYLPAKFKNLLNYVFVSYYEDDCNNYQPDWQRVFDSLHVLFPYAKIGIGECGTTNANKKAEYITRYYTMNITTPGYIGGYFWWYYRQDCIPYSTKPLWQVLENAVNSPPGPFIIAPGDVLK